MTTQAEKGKKLSYQTKNKVVGISKTPAKKQNFIHGPNPTRLACQGLPTAGASHLQESKIKVWTFILLSFPLPFSGLRGIYNCRGNTRNVSRENFHQGFKMNKTIKQNLIKSKQRAKRAAPCNVSGKAKMTRSDSSFFYSFSIRATTFPL